VIKGHGEGREEARGLRSSRTLLDLIRASCPAAAGAASSPVRGRVARADLQRMQQAAILCGIMCFVA
jgi:hypothetical protein